MLDSHSCVLPHPNLSPFPRPSPTTPGSDILPLMYVPVNVFSRVDLGETQSMIQLQVRQPNQSSPENARTYLESRVTLRTPGCSSASSRGARFHPHHRLLSPDAVYGVAWGSPTEYSD